MTSFTPLPQSKEMVSGNAASARGGCLGDAGCDFGAMVYSFQISSSVVPPQSDFSIS